MDPVKKQQVLDQYVNQYQPVITQTLAALAANKNHLHIPYAQFLFSAIDYYGLLFTVASTRHYNKRETQNFKNFVASDYFPLVDRCKGSFLYFIRNGLIHQIFSKASAVGTSLENKLFFKDVANGDIAALNLDYLHRVTVSAIDSFIDDLNIRADYIDNVFDLLITTNYGFNDHTELTAEIGASFGGDSNKIFEDCV